MELSIEMLKLVSAILFSASCFMSQKQPKPTLSGQRIRTRKRGACIVWSLVE